ncbi:MAG: class I SAM-dependent methyltransferase [Planctomycetota bacterium]
MSEFSGPCPVCGGERFAAVSVMFAELVDAWQLSTEEVAYIDRQQGYHCLDCRNNLRAMALGAAIARELAPDRDSPRTLRELCNATCPVRILEINGADSLTATLAACPGHRRVEYPEVDMQQMPFAASAWDLVVHSDTLEHVPDPVQGLAECRRILVDGGACLFTVPVIVGRPTRSRAGLPPSYHGAPGTSDADQLVHTEFGDDVWQWPLRAGFHSCEVFALEHPAALVMIARKG